MQKNGKIKNMKKIIFFTISALVFIIPFSILLLRQNKKIEPEIEKKELKIVTTLFPLYDFARAIGGEKISVTLLLPPGVEAHGFEPKPSDILRIHTSDIFIYTGEFMEPWAGDILKSAPEKLLKTNSSKGITLMAEIDGDHEENAYDSHKGPDPHFWLDFENAQKMIDTILESFKKADPKNENFYEKNADEYKEKIKALDAMYEKTFFECKNKEIVYAGHYAFGYLVKRYNLTYTATQGFAPDSEPTAQTMIRIVENIRSKKIKYIFYEELASPKIAETIASETDATMLILNTAHNVGKTDFENRITFISIMENNLHNLKIGLECP